MVDSSPQTQPSVSEQFVARRGIDHAEYLASLIGKELSEGKWLESKARNQKIARLTDQVADALEKQGVQARRTDGNLVSVVGKNGEVEPLIGSLYRHINFLPAVQQMESRAWSRDLQHFIDQNPRSRMWVMTYGERCSIKQVRERMREMSRAISRLGYYLKRKGLVKLQAARNEFTIKRHGDGSASFHIHAHLVIVPVRYLEKDKWEGLLGDVKRNWGYHWHDSGQIRDARECSKYLTKLQSGDADNWKTRNALHELYKDNPWHSEGRVIGLLDLHNWEIAELHKQLFRLQLSRKMGDFLEQCGDRKRNRVTIRKMGEGKWREVRKPSSGGARQKQNGTGRSLNIVLGRCITTFSRPVLEVGLIVQNYSGDLSQLLALRFPDTDPFAPARPHYRSQSHDNSPNPEDAFSAPDPPWDPPPRTLEAVASSG